jgi:hypothetical protein
MFKKRSKQQPVRRTRLRHEMPKASRAFSYYSAKRPVDIEDVDQGPARLVRDEGVSKANRNVLAKRLGVLLVVGIVVGLLFYNAQLSPSKTQVVLLGKPDQQLFLHDTAQYKKAAEAFMANKMQNRTKPTFNSKAFNDALVKQFPEIAGATVSLPLFGSAAKVSIEPSSAALLFVASNNKSYVVDTNGRVLASNTADAPMGLPVVSDQSGVNPEFGKQVLPAGDVESMLLIFGQLKEKNLRVESMLLPNAAQRLEVRIQGRPYAVRFNLHDAVLQQVGAYIAVQHKLDREGVTPVEYIDVRVADRVYYK